MINHLQQQKNWQKQISEAITDINELLTVLELTHLQDKFYQPQGFGLKIPRSFVAKMQVGNAQDPLFLQVVPNKKALVKQAGYITDPLAEAAHNPNKGILHKYKSRVLLTVTGACAVHCRYCFRQHFDYGANTPASNQINDVIAYINQHPEVNEVIFSGGDPFSLSNRRLADWLTQLTTLKQIKTIRFHTRLPIVIPDRVDEELTDILGGFSQKVNLLMVLHVNHANEIDNTSASYFNKLKKAGVTLLSQTVLLADVNDDVATQVNLNQKLFDFGVLPYYLHVLDKVEGAAYFDMSEQKAIELYWQMLAELPGFLMPRLVREVADKPYKVPINLYQHFD